MKNHVDYVILHIHDNVIVTLLLATQFVFAKFHENLLRVAN